MTISNLYWIITITVIMPLNGYLFSFAPYLSIGLILIQIPAILLMLLDRGN